MTPAPGDLVQAIRARVPESHVSVMGVILEIKGEWAYIMWSDNTQTVRRVDALRVVSAA